MNTLSIKNLGKTYANGVVAIRDVSLELGNGMFGLLGPNGAGKSSLMRSIAGLQSHDTGSIQFNGMDVSQNPLAVKSRLGYLPQDFGVYPKISAWRLLDHLAVLKGVSLASERKAQIESLLVKTNLYANRNQAVSTFSGGMRQRFGIAQALLGSPKLIIVDEPTAGLDPEERYRFNNLLSELGEEVIVILSTHLVEDVRTLCTSMAIMYRGTLIAGGRPDEFVRELDGKLWSKRIDKSQLDVIRTQHLVISSHFQAGQLNVVVRADAEPGEGFHPHSPDLEDVYFSAIAHAHV